MEGEWSCYRSGHFYEGRMVMLQEIASLMEREWSCYGGSLFNGRENGHVTEVASIRRENGHVTEVVSLMEGEWSCYR